MGCLERESRVIGFMPSDVILTSLSITARTQISEQVLGRKVPVPSSLKSTRNDGHPHGYIV